MTATVINTEQLVELLQQRDRQGFSMLYDQYAGTLLGILQRIVNDEHIAEDLLQEVFVKVWRNIQTFERNKGTFFTWLLNIARNSAVDHLRSKLHKSHKLQTGIEVQDYHVHSAHNLNIESIGLKKLVGILEPKYREVIDMIYFWGYTQDEVSKLLNMPLGTVKTRTRMGIQILREYYGKE